ncbi:subtilisin-like protein [Polyplosphaeria fusca]|uniref:tripeptidyl-peptidase II n=1 Tax=Polyplosphaeria fusca TaxID=682080 RepID=A0A9P4QSU6_9PLEO|nr:subtilisin-like protein [Polyplosphaeria fusca]
MHFLLCTVAALVALTSALPTAPNHSHVIHEKRNSLPAKWAKRSRMDSTAILPVRIGLKQRNVDRAHEYLDSVSNPTSKSYGKHWSIEDVRNTFAPNDESRDTVLQWLSQNGVSTVKNEGALHTLEFDMSVAEAERLLKTEYFVYEHDGSGTAHVACEEYSVPEHVSDHINIITPTLHFDVKPSQHLQRRDIPNPADPLTGSHPYHEEYQGPTTPTKAGDDDNSDSMQTCLDAITPDCLRSLYNIPEPTSSPSSDNSFGVVEYSPNTYNGDDLDQFFTSFTKFDKGARPDLVSVNDGTLDDSDPSSFELHGESNLDFQYAMGLTNPQKVTLYQIGGNTMTASDADFIKTKVVSTSWGFNEKDLTPMYMETLCNEYMKLGLQGISILFSTADHGVAGNTETCDNNDRFQPDFPASCPYVTAVGATMLDASATDIAGTLSSGGQPEVAIDSNVISGGGFSDVFAMPDYQQDVVAKFLKDSPPSYSGDQFNNSGNARGLPDISLNGHGYAVIVGGKQQAVDGTSASTPAFAAMITLINEERLAAGKGTVGFLNPVLYQYADKYVKDVTSGRNPGCGTDGFEAVEGWDPVTGLGTPDYVGLRDVFMGLD